MNSAAENRTCPGCGAAIPANAPQGICPKCLMAAAAVATDTGQTGGKRPEPPSLEQLAAVFPQLEVIEFIGQGGMGAVYKARQKQLDRVVALKVLPPGIGGDAAFAERFTREAKALAKLLHPNIVALFEFGQADGIYYLLMEYVDGVSLGQLLRSSRVSPREALAIVPQICDALQYAHDQGIVHRDIKPENILLDRRGRVKVADFGLAKLVEANGPLSPTLSPSEGERGTARPGEEKTPALTGAGKVMGTPNYMAPEQVEHPGEVDHRADIYALGVVFYQMLTGELPGKAIEPPSKKVQIDVRLDEVVLRALEREPELRYQQASQVKTAVETISSSSAPVTGTAPLPARPAATRSRRRAALTVALVVWFFVAGTVTVITWIRAESWKVVAVISCPRKLQPGRPVDMDYFKHAATMIELIRSDVILGRVIDRLELDERSGKLDERWGKRNLGLKLTKAQAIDLLRRRLDVRSSEGGTLIQVGVYGKRPEKPEEAMDIADAIAKELRAFRIEQHDPPADMLEMTLRYTAPDILLGLAAGFVPGLLAGGLVLWRGSLRRGSQASQVKKGVETIVGGAGIPPAQPVRKNSTGKIIAIGCGVLVAGGLVVLLLTMALYFLESATPVAPTAQNLSFGPVKQVSATAARSGDIGVRLESPGTVESSDSVMFAISEDYCQAVIRKFDAHQAMTVEAYDARGEKRFGHGLLAGVDNRIDTATGTLKCRASLTPEGENLMVPGLFLNIRLLLEVKHGVTLVPNVAIQRDPQSDYVWVIQSDHTLTRRPVRVGAVDGSWAEIRSGLSPGEVVAGDGFNGLQEGQKIRYKLVPDAATTPAAPAAAQNLSLGPVIERQVNKPVSDFPETTDLSTPESACAAWQRATAHKDAQAVSRLSWVKIDPAEEEAWFRNEEAHDREGLAIYLKALTESKIVVVLTWRGELADVITFLPFPPGKGRHPYSARSFGRIGGQWKNLGEDRLPSLEAARASFEQKKAAIWEQLQSLQSAASGVAPVAPPVAAKPVPLNQVIELTLADVRSGKESLASLATGGTRPPDFTAVRGDDPAGRAWLRAQDIDLVYYARTDSGDSGVGAYDLRLAKVPNAQFDSMDADGLVKALSGVERTEGGLMSVRDGLPVTYVFETRRGLGGVLQITGFTDNPRGVKIRYKLVQPAASGSSAAKSQTSADRSAASGVRDVFRPELSNQQRKRTLLTS